MVLSGCNSSHPEKGYVPETQNESDILVYNAYESKFISYDPEGKSYIDASTDNVLQYSFRESGCPYYTSGHSYDNGFVILKYDNGSLRKIKTADKDIAVFPLAYDEKNDKAYYFRYKDDSDNEMESTPRSDVVTVDDDGNEKIIVRDMDIGETGVMCGDMIYYPSYNESEDTYSVYRLDPETGKTETAVDKVDSGDIYCVEDKLYISDDKYIYPADKNNKSKRFDKGAENYFLDGRELMIQYVVSKDETLDIVIRNYNNKILSTYKEVAGFEVDKDKITIYEDGNI